MLKADPEFSNNPLGYDCFYFYPLFSGILLMQESTDQLEPLSADLH